MTDVLDSILLERFTAHADPVAPPDFADVRRRARSLGARVARPRPRWSRRTLVAVAVGALVVAGTATAVGRHHLFGSSGYRVVSASGDSIPGLPGMGALLPVSSAASPTAAECADAWNEQAPDETRRWVGAQNVAGVTLGPGVMRGEGLRLGTFCNIRLVLDGHKSALIQGPWTEHGAPRWRGAVVDSPAPGAILLRSTNAVIDRNGTIACRLRCDVTARLPVQPAPPPSSAVPTEHVPDACSLLTPAEVAAALGDEPRHRVAETGSRSSSCMWHDEPLTSLDRIVLNVQMVGMPKADFESAMSRNPRMRKLDGVGEAVDAWSNGTVLAVWYRGFAITVFSRTASPLDTEKRLAAIVIARL